MKISQLELKRFVIANIGIVGLTLVINLLAWKYTLVSAGITGYALALSYLIHISVGTILLVLNGIILLLNWLILGKAAGIKALYGYFVFSVMIDLTRYLFQISQTPVSSIVEQIVFMSILSVLIAIFISLIIVSGYSVGSYSAMLPVINKYVDISAAKLFIICDAILTVITWLLFGFEKALVLFIHAAILSLSLKYILPYIKKLLNPS